MTAVVADGHQASLQAPYPVNCRFGDSDSEYSKSDCFACLFESVQLGFSWVGFAHGLTVNEFGPVSESRVVVVFTVHIGFVIVSL
jgi:hypothetical protein